MVLKYFLNTPAQDPEKRGTRRGAASLLVHSPTFLDLNISLLGGGHCGGYSVLVRDVAGKGDGLAAVGPNRLGDLLRAVDTDVEECDGRAFGRKALSRALADAAPAAVNGPIRGIMAKKPAPAATPTARRAGRAG